MKPKGKMLNSTNIAQLNRALENSFGAIKRDMNEIKLALKTQAESNTSLKKDVEALREDVVTKDKINVLKIKIGEINEGLKKIWDVEKELKSKGYSSSYKDLQKRLDELNAKFIGTELKLNELNKTSVSEIQMKTLIEQINSELNKMASNLREAETRRDEVRREDIEYYTKQLAQRLNSTNKDLDLLRKEVKTYVDKTDVKKILDDINKEFTDVRKEMNSISKRDSAFVREAEIKDILENINDEFDGIAQEISSIKKNNKEYVSANQIKGLIDDISDEFNDIRRDLAKVANVKDIATKRDVEAVKKDLKNLDSQKVSRNEFERELGIIDKELESVSSVPENYGASVILDTKKPSKKAKLQAPMKIQSHRKKYLFGNVLIFLSFMSLIASVVAYYYGQQMLMDQFAITAVIVFVIGMVFRIYSVLKSSKV